MRILLTIDDMADEKGGPSRSVAQLAEALQLQGQIVAIWTKQTWRNPKLSVGIESYSGKFSAAVANFQPDIVHDNGIWESANREVASVCARGKIVRVVTPHGTLMPWSLNQKKWKKRAAWYAYQRRDITRANLVHATAQPEADQLKALGYRGRIMLAANGVELPAQIPERKRKKPPRVALFLSRIHKKKGIPMLIEAWATVQPPNWVAQIVGPDQGGHRAELETMVKSLGLSESWTFEDELVGADKWQAFADADLFVLPTHSENFGIVVTEALGMGVPVLTTTGTPWKGLASRGCGWCVRPTVDAIAAALSEACSLDSIRLRKMGDLGAAWVREEFLWESIAKKMIVDYQSLLS